jgi:ubiquinone/menaquinone biosynthesis C-methylase UbiE
MRLICTFAAESDARVSCTNKYHPEDTMTKTPIAAGKSSFDLVDTGVLFAATNLREDKVILDLACGVGNYALALAAHTGPGGTIHAVDLWEEGIAALRSEAVARNMAWIHPAVADISRRIPLDDDGVDVCLMATVLHDLKQDGTHTGTLNELRRVLKPLGTLVVVEFKKINGPPGPPLQVRLSPAETEALLEPFGFVCDRVVDIGPFNYLARFSLRL